MKRNSLLIALSLLIAVATSACDDIGQMLSGDSGQDSNASSDAPPANVDLPPVPRLDLLDIPAQYPDDSRSVIGAIQAKDELFGDTLTVKAILVELYQCDVPAAADDDENVAADAEQEEEALDPNRAGCLRPHLYLADTENSPRRLLATGYNHRLYDSQLEAGLRYTFTGSYREASAGFSSSDGLLVVDKIEGNGLRQEEAEPTEGE